jgi:hypothetical protein
MHLIVLFDETVVVDIKEANYILQNLSLENFRSKKFPVLSVLYFEFVYFIKIPTFILKKVTKINKINKFIINFNGALLNYLCSCFKRASASYE